MVLVAPAGLDNPSTCCSVSILLSAIRVLMLHRILWAALVVLSKCWPRLHAWSRRVLLGSQAPTYGIDRGVFNLDESMHVHLVWGARDVVHSYALSDFYWQRAPHVHLKTVTAWGHKQLCAGLGKLQLEQYSAMWEYDTAASGAVQSEMEISPAGAAPATGAADAGGRARESQKHDSKKKK